MRSGEKIKERTAGKEIEEMAREGGQAQDIENGELEWMISPL